MEMGIRVKHPAVRSRGGHSPAGRCSLRSLTAAAALGACIVLLASDPVFAACDCGSTNPGSACTGTSASNTVGNSTIRFDFTCNGGACRCGQFANEWDYWVAPAANGGTVKITSMTPAATGSGASFRNGAVVDPSSTGDEQGWDGTDITFGLSYVPSLSISTPYSVNTSAVGRPVVILKARSDPSNVGGGSYCNNDRMCLDHVEALTVVERPPGDVFRPPYFGTEKPMFPASALDTSILPNLPDVGDEPDYLDAAKAVTSVAIDHAWGWKGREQFHPRKNYDDPNSGYDAYIAQKEQRAYLALLTEPTTAQQADEKELLARRVAQRGIDLYYIFQNGGQGSHPTCGGWFGAGGYGTGKLTPILMTTALLGLESSWGSHIDSVLSTEVGRQCFAETSIIQPPDPGGKNVALFGHKTTSVYTVSSGSKTAADPNGKIDGGGNSASTCVSTYQSCCTTGPLRGAALPMWLIPEVADNFPSGARPWLDFTDRVKQTGGAYCSPNSFAVTPYSPGYGVQYADDLYDAYRSCADDQSCPGMTPIEGLPPAAPVLLP